MLGTETTARSSTDELELTLETLKDLTVPSRQADGVKGGVTSGKALQCLCGTW